MAELLCLGFEPLAVQKRHSSCIGFVNPDTGPNSPTSKQKGRLYKTAKLAVTSINLMTTSSQSQPFVEAGIELEPGTNCSNTRAGI